MQGARVTTDHHPFGVRGFGVAPALAMIATLLWLYAPGFHGFWLGDDFGHLHQTFNWAQDGKLWSETMRKFSAPADAIGNFYRPLIFVTLSANFALSGANYWGWFLTNLLLHVACALLLMWVLRRAAASVDRDAGTPAALVTLLFAASPLLVEGVMWVSARSDLAVTTLAMLAAGLWLAPDHRDRRGFDPRFVIPLLVLVGLGFKESAAVLPLQLLLLALARPRSVGRSGWWVLVSCAGVVVVFLAARAWWFESAWHAYADGGERSLPEAVRSLPEWWHGAVAAAPRTALTWLLACLAAALLSCRFARGHAPQLKLAAAFAGAGAGQLLATLLNLGNFAANGEGGRLLYGPIAWFALSLGVLIASSLDAEASPTGRTRRRLARIFVGLAVICGILATHARVAQFASVQSEMRDLTAAIGRYAIARTDTTVLAIPDQRLGVVAARNGQGALVMPPLQSKGLLHRVVPTLPEELALRPAQFAAGLGTQLTALQPQRADLATLRLMLQPAPPSPAPAYACWASGSREIVPVTPAEPDAIGPQLCASSD